MYCKNKYMLPMNEWSAFHCVCTFMSAKKTKLKKYPQKFKNKTIFFLVCT